MHSLTRVLSPSRASVSPSVGRGVMMSQPHRLNTWLCTPELQPDFAWKGPLEVSDLNLALNGSNLKFKSNLTVISGGSVLPQLNFEFLWGYTGDNKLSMPHA